MSKRKAKKPRRMSDASRAAFALRNANASAAVSTRYKSQKYTPIALESLTNKQLSSELSKARSILRKRVERAQAQGLYSPDRLAYLQGLLTPVKSVPVSDRPERLSEIARALSGETTVQGIKTKRNQIIETMHAHGYNFITPENFNDWTEFVNEFSYKERSRIYGSGDSPGASPLYQYFIEQKERVNKGDAVKLSRRSFLLWLARREKTGMSEASAWENWQG